jgi:hypothetical protein
MHAMSKVSLEQVHQAFQIGRHRSPSNDYSAPGRLFASRLKEEVSSRVPTVEFSAIDSLWQKLGQALWAAKKNDLEGSRNRFRSTRSALEESLLSEVGILLVRTLLDPAEAYYHYKLDDYSRARELVLSGVAVNHRLTGEFGVGIIGAQRMQLCHNILRITTREGKGDQTVRLAGSYLNYLEHNRTPLLDEIEWAEIVRDFPDSIVQFYFDQVCGEAALALAGNSDSRLFSWIADHAIPNACSPHYASHGHSWISITQRRFEGDIDEYLHRVCELLQLGRTAEPSLWFATAFDVAAVCRMRGPEGAKIANSIHDEMSIMPEAPWIFSVAKVTSCDVLQR